MARATIGYGIGMDGHHHRSRLSGAVQQLTAAAGSVTASVLAVTALAAWLAIGLVNGFSERWYAVLWTASSAVTFLMVFAIQHVTNRESRAILLKLDELIRIQERARDDLIRVEERPMVEQEHLEKEMRRSTAG